MLVNKKGVRVADAIREPATDWEITQNATMLAVHLRCLGYQVEDVAKILNRTSRTIYRYWEDIDKNLVDHIEDETRLIIEMRRDYTAKIISKEENR
jgi:hypothetical protein